MISHSKSNLEWYTWYGDMGEWNEGGVTLVVYARRPAQAAGVFKQLEEWEERFWRFRKVLSVSRRLFRRP